MVDVASITAAVTGLKTATDIAKSLLEIKSIGDVQAKVIELQAVILSAQSSALAAQSDQFALMDQIRDLKAEIARLENWDAESKRYQLTEVGRGRFAFALKPGMENGEPPHHLCAHCHNDKQKKSILQRAYFAVGRAEALECHSCHSRIYTQGVWDPQHDGGKAKR